tara:strand:- start:3517 stop:3885 length:369 start_codon:yes stop_codon:yes gene_type:complete
MRKLKHEMEEDRFEEHCAELFTEAIEDIFEDCEREMLELREAEFPPRIVKFFLDEIMDDLKDAEKKIQVMREQGWDIEDMRCILEGWEFQYRQKFNWVDPPTKDQVPDIRWHMPQSILMTYS